MLVAPSKRLCKNLPATTSKSHKKGVAAVSTIALWLRERTWVERLIVLGVANLLLIACAQVRIPLPFTPVPITGQTFGVLLAGALLGHRYGTAVVMAYLLQGAFGLPVFSGWKGGLVAFFGPTGGYLLGFVPAAFLVGWLLERGWAKTFHRTLAALLLGNAVIYAFGLPWLAVFVGWQQVIMQGCLPFLPGDFLKALAAATVAAKLVRNR